MNPHQSDDLTRQLYRSKKEHYYSGVRRDWIAYLDTIPSERVLEVGCGAGETGRALLESGISQFVAGIEFSPVAAAIARGRLSEVIEGNVERLDLPWPMDSFDAILISEVLEHLIDPQSTLSKLHRYLRPGGTILASSPNISHHKVIRSLIAGKWELEDSGVMDRTHLRWFTPSSYRSLFEEAGYTVTESGPLSPFTRKAAFINWIMGGRFSHLFVVQIQIRAVKSSTLRQSVAQKKRGRQKRPMN